MNGLAKTVSLDSIFCKLLQLALGQARDFSFSLNEKEWRSLLYMAMEQAMLGVTYQGILKLPKEVQPPRAVAIQWSAAAETIRGSNQLMNQEAARYTKLFEERGVRGVILKGQANARLYPDPFSRQTGDIDLWLPGGFDKLVQLLNNLNFITNQTILNRNSHQIAFHNKNDIDVEIHHKFAVDVPYRSKEFHELLITEIKSFEMTPEGFYVPSIRFALLMQLSHLKQHIYEGGVGLRHFTDYFILLTHSSIADREYIKPYITRFGLERVGGAVMWVLEKVFNLSKEYMLCTPDIRRGRYLYSLTMVGGNFGRHAPQRKKETSVFKRWLNDRLYALRWMRYDPIDALSSEIRYWKDTLSLIPERIRHRKIAL